MLDAAFDLEIFSGPLSSDGRSAAATGARLVPFASDQIGMSLSGTDDWSEVWIGEDVDPGGDLHGSVGIDHYRNFSGHEGLKLRLERGASGGRLTIGRTGAGSTPLYVSTHRGKLAASWMFEQAVHLLPDPRPHAASCRIFLDHNATQIREQVIEGVFMLWPGEALRFDSDGLSFQEAEIPEIVLPATLADDARVSEAFVALIAETLRRAIGKASFPVLELSGGLDSTCVGVAAATLGLDLNSYGLIHEGAMGVQQRGRRAEMLARIGAKDFEYPSWEHTPVQSLAVEECQRTPFDDNHRLPCVYALDAHPGGRCDLVITGIGGDELCLENTFFRHPWELKGSVCTSALVAATARADMFMRRGIWPANPLIARPVVDFCRALPRKLRERRLLNLLTLARAGFSDGFLFPRYFEHYGNAMQREAALFDYDRALGQSIVADFAIADISPLLEQARQASYGGFSYELLSKLYNLLKLETVLRRYVR